MTRYIKFIAASALLLGACESNIDVKIPQGMYDAEKVFESTETTASALRGIYQSMTTGGFSGRSNPFIGVLAGLNGMSADELTRASYSADQQLFIDNNLNAESTGNAGLWASIYNYVYQCNRFIEGVEQSTQITGTVREQFLGEARFIRALSFFYLTNLYGSVPMPLTSVYTETALMPQTSVDAIYKQVIIDLQYAISVLDPVNPASEKRYQATYWTAKALLARVYLYERKWELAEAEATDVIQNPAFVLETLARVFVEGSKEAIWQLSNAGSNIYSAEAALLSSGWNITTNPAYRMTSHILSQFETGDQRRTLWTVTATTGTAIGSVAPRKLRTTTNVQPNAIKEASTPLRLAELYLIRAEAYAQQGKRSEAIADIDMLRKRAGASESPTATFQTLAVSNPDISQDDLISFIYAERMRELFAENGHRWFDAKRSGLSLKEFFGDRKPNIRETDTYYPTPLADLQRNPNLDPTDGY